MLKKSDNGVLISPSIIATDLSTLGNRLQSLDPKIIDLLHIDVMDGNFVPNLTIGPGYIKALQTHTEIPLDIHLMIESPENSIDEYIRLKPWSLTIHYESTRFPIRLLNKIRESKITAGISINPATPISAIYDILQYSDMVLIMSVDPGFYGQGYLESSTRKIVELKQYIEKNDLTGSVIIQVDGGITQENIGKAVKAGAQIIVAGNAAFSGGNPNENVKILKERASS